MMKKTPLKRKPYKLNKQTKLPIGKLKRDLLDLAKRHVRERDARCLMAGADGRKCWGYLQASHIFPEGIYHSFKFDPENMITACTQHHIYWWHKSPLEANGWLKGHLGEERYTYLFKLRDAYKQKQWFTNELTQLIQLTKSDLASYDKHYEPFRPSL